jgi:hypothetical protein
MEWKAIDISIQMRHSGLGSALEAATPAPGAGDTAALLGRDTA